MKKSHTQQGFVILFTVFLATIILTVALALTDMGLKQVQLSVTAREGHEAFFAADTGIECALYWDTQGAFSSQVSDTVTCNNESVTVTSGLSYKGSRFDIPIDVGQEAHCASVFVYKNYTAADTADGASLTRIESFGRNQSCDAEDDSRTVERALRVMYPN